MHHTPRPVAKQYFCFLFLLLSACGPDKEPISRFIDFEYPLDSLRRGKVFVYKKNVPNDYHFVEDKLVDENGMRYILRETSNMSGRVSSEKYAVRDNGIEVMEVLFYRYDSLTKESVTDQTELTELKNLDNGLPYRGYSVEINITEGQGSTEGKVSSKQIFIRQDKLDVMQQRVDVLVFTNDFVVSSWYKYLPFISKSITYTGENYYARGLGLVKYSQVTAGQNFEWELVAIRNLNSRP